MLALVVDDDVAVRSFIESILHAERFETLEAGDGEQAWPWCGCSTGKWI